MDERVRPLSADEALARLREVGVVEGIAAFAERVGWERTRASRTVDGWARDGKVVCRARPGRKTLIEAVVTAVPVVREPVPRLARVPARHMLGSITPWSATVALLVATALFVAGLTINITFAMSYAPQSVWGAVLMAMVGAAIEVLALLSPSWGCQLWWPWCVPGCRGSVDRLAGHGCHVLDGRHRIFCLDHRRRACP